MDYGQNVPSCDPLMEPVCSSAIPIVPEDTYDLVSSLFSFEK